MGNSTHGNHPMPSNEQSAVNPPSPVLVWDVAVRVFHWLLVAGITIAWLTGGTGYRIHEIAGFGITALVAFRLVWGFVGSRHARFRDFVTGPRRVTAYAAAHVRNTAPRHLGHNPAGGYMILALLSVIAIICVTGIMQLSHRFYGVEWVEEAHHYAANALLVLIPLHILGAIVSSVMQRENLIGAMFTGKKAPADLPARPNTARLRFQQRLHHLDIRARSRSGLAAVLMVTTGGLAYGWIATSGRTATEETETAGSAPRTAVTSTATPATPPPEAGTQVAANRDPFPELHPSAATAAVIRQTIGHHVPSGALLFASATSLDGPAATSPLRSAAASREAALQANGQLDDAEQHQNRERRERTAQQRRDARAAERQRQTEATQQEREQDRRDAKRERLAAEQREKLAEAQRAQKVSDRLEAARQQRTAQRARTAPWQQPYALGAGRAKLGTKPWWPFANASGGGGNGSSGGSGGGNSGHGGGDNSGSGSGSSGSGGGGSGGGGGGGGGGSGK